MNKFIMSLVITVFAVGIFGPLVYAAVEVKSAGTRVGKAETLNITGATATSSGNTVAISTLISAMTVDTALYTKAAGTGGSKALRISADGTIYAN